jgi:DNA-binding transcriptional LysR family regulator
LELKQIEIFIKVAKYKNFSKAANALFLSQPAVSAQISALEKELEVQLFNRTSKEVVLTEEGHIFLEHAILIVNTFHDAIMSLAKNKRSAGILNLHASTAPCSSLVPELVRQYKNLYPEVQLNIIEQNSEKVIEDILKFNCEIGIIGSEVKDSRIKSYVLKEDELVLISHPSLGLSEVVDAAELLRHPLILRERGSATRKTFEEALEEVGIQKEELMIGCEVNSLDAMFKFVKSGLGLSIASRSICEEQSTSLKVSRIEGLDLKRNLSLIVSSRRSLTPATMTFFCFCKEVFQFKE